MGRRTLGRSTPLRRWNLSTRPAPSALGLHQRLQRRHPFHDRCADSMEARADAMSSRLIAGAPTTPGLLTDKLLDVAL